MKFNFSWKNRYPKIVAAIGCINNVKEEEEAGRNANEWVIKDCPRNWQINPKRNNAIIAVIAWGIRCSSKISDAKELGKEVGKILKKKSDNSYKK